MAHADNRESSRQLVVFELGGETYGVDISRVSEIVEMRRITIVPWSPPFVEGIINLRGTVLPVIDLRKRFRLSEKAVDHLARIVVIQVAAQPLGLIVDSVTEVLSLFTSQIDLPSPIVVGPDSTFIEGVARHEDRLIIVLDSTKLLSDTESDQLQVAG